MDRGNVLFIVTLCMLVTCDVCFGTKYKPVVIFHGILTGNVTMIPIAKRINELHPGTIMYITDRYSGWSSLTPMWHQVLEFGKDLMKISELHPEGIHLIGYSQGGLIARAVLEQFPQHNVKNFISLSAPQAGQYGTNFLHLIFPSLVCETAFELFYSLVGQHTSVGNYWNDPHHQPLYFKYSRFLPYVNNELTSAKSDVYKSGLVKLDHLVLIGGPNDGVITPWQSSHFGYFNDKEEVVEMKQRDAYGNDSFGLRTLDLQGKLTLVEVSGVSHFAWHKNLSVIDKYIVPFLG